MTARRRLSPTLAFFEVCCRLGDLILIIARGHECPVCLERHRDLDAHLHVDHGNGGI